MKIEYGSVEYFELLSLQDRLKYWRYDKLDLQYLDKLKMEIDIKIKSINKEDNDKRRIYSIQE